MSETIMIPEDKQETLGVIANIEKRNINEILSELIDDYIERHKETLEILSQPEWVNAISEGLNASERKETVRWRTKNSGMSSHKTFRECLVTKPLPALENDLMSASNLLSAIPCMAIT
ncbi:hypothetical protein [Candidatus Magnetomonas plexicatena]|uniref:hypothetical protein n=1 Tax=Candidatus Magnetomonas plexicatena TaxID=2552947 RepID=UPI0011026CF4